MKKHTPIMNIPSFLPGIYMMYVYVMFLLRGVLFYHYHLDILDIGSTA